MESADLARERGSDREHDHQVEFYETEAFLVETVCGLLVPALRRGDAGIVVATANHTEMFETAMRTAGIDVEAAVRGGRYLPLDADLMLSLCMVDGQPDAALFRQAITVAMDRASQDGRRIRVYDEMVAVLQQHEEDDVDSALALEDLWNDMATTRSFSLLCAYPMQAFRHEGSAAAFRRICEQHATVIPSESYSLLPDDAARCRFVAQLQQLTAALQAEVLRLRPLQERDEPGLLRDQAGDQRDNAGVLRDQAGDLRDRAAEKRDHAGDLRDKVAQQRDHAAEERDHAAEERDHAAERSEASVNATIAAEPLSLSAVARRDAASDRRRASQDRRAGASERNRAELDRGTAVTDRGSGASERTHAELDRNTALADRGASAREREDASIDDLTGAHLRGAGFVELEREIGRALRTRQPLVVAFVDVDHLKWINDSRGHAAGDRMLLQVATTLKSWTRAYDLIIRYGGDEFVWVMSGLDMSEATKRVAAVDATLAVAPEHGSVTVGLAELRPDDSPTILVARADAELYRKRQQQRAIRPGG